MRELIMYVPKFRFAILLTIFALPLPILAQPPRGEGFSPWGGGGPPGGMRGDTSGRGGPPAGGFSQRGGPPGGGGFPGGGFPGGGTRGGPPGGGDRGGQSNGGSRGGPPGGGDRGGGGFDPASMLSRLDANGNGSIDPDEMQGPARFMLDRIAGNNPEIAAAMKSSKPIPLSKVTKAFEAMRGGSSDSSNSSRSGPPSSSSAVPAEPEPLVPDFGVKKELMSVLGFGVGGSQASAVKVEDRDLKEAVDRLQRYDRNKDGILDEKEIREGRWSDNPMQFDRNGDKKINAQELAVRYAKRRLAEELEKQNKQAASNAKRDGRGEERSRDSKEEEVPINPWSNQASYKITPRYGPTAKVQGLPEWFASSDANSDGQVMMNEYASSWDEATLKEFGLFDSNGDGTITTLETLAAVKKGVLRGSAASVSSGSSPSTASPASAKPALSTAELDRSDLPADAEDRWVQFASLQIKKNDKDQNGRLTPDEWSASSGDFNAVDKNGDGSITLGEYYIFRKKK